MAERRSYRRTAEPTPAPEQEQGGYSGDEQEQAPPQRSTSERKPWNRGGGKSRQDDGEYINLTGLFQTKSGKADTVVLTPDILKKFDEMNEGDVLGVSQNKKNGRLQLWYIRKAN